MNPLNLHLNTIEQMICNKADLNHIPISGTFELLPLCNMNCKMCFAKMTVEQMNSHAPMRDYKSWLNLAKQASDAGMMFVLLTGGEPFLYPNFKELYFGLKKLGLVISINTNATLINEEIANWLASDPPRRLNITLYGASNETYKRLCQNPIGFTQVIKAIKLLQERKIPIKLNCSLTPENVNDLDDIYHIADTFNLPIETAYYMMPAVRECNIGNEQYRLTPHEAAKAKLRIKQLEYGNDIFKEYIIGTLDRYYDIKNNKLNIEKRNNGFNCRAGNSVFWINYDGTMVACNFVPFPKYNVFDTSFIESWKKLYKEILNIHLSNSCYKCLMKSFCSYCGASIYTENKGDYSIAPKYHCELTKYYIKLLKQKAKEYSLYED